MKLNLKPKTSTKAAGSLLVNLSPEVSQMVEEMAKAGCQASVVELAVELLWVLTGDDEMARSIWETGKKLGDAFYSDSDLDINLRCLVTAVEQAQYLRERAMGEIDGTN